MIKKLKRLTGQGEEGQSLVLLAFALLVVIGATALSVDVGRAYWAKTQVQAAVDAAALAGAAGLPNTTTAGTQADLYWDLNNNFLESQGNNVTLTKSYSLAPSKVITVTGSADVNTWFAKVFGINSWHVSATASAEFQQVDAVVVLDRSGSMCYDSHSQGSNNFYGMVRLNSSMTNGLKSNGSQDTNYHTQQVTVAKDSSVSSKPLSDLIWVGQRFKFDGTNEWMEVQSIDSADKITVKRGVGDPNGTSSSSTRAAHSAGSSSNYSWMRGSTCTQAGKGPFLPWAYVKTGGNIFVNNMNSAYDQIAYIDFGSTARLNQDFTSSFTSLKTTITNTWDPGITTDTNMNGRGTDHYTNISHAIWYGVNRHLTSPNKRTGVSKVMVLLSDGAATAYCSNYGSGSAQGTSCTSSGYVTNSVPGDRARQAATYAAANNIIIYTISYGNDADEDLMQDIADATGGKHYVTPNEATLNTAFQDIAKSTHVKLTQ